MLIPEEHDAGTVLGLDKEMALCYNPTMYEYVNEVIPCVWTYWASALTI